jgi:hypothetical protein
LGARSLPQHKGATPYNKRMTPEMEQQLLRLYAGGQSAPQILKALGYPFKTPKTIYDILHKQGLPVRRPSRIDYCQDSCWHDAFAEISTEAQAYWLGLLIADGWVSKGQTPGTWHIGLQLQEQDRAHVEAFKAFLRASQAVIPVRKVQRSTGRQFTMYRLLVNSQRLRRDLAPHGVVERKSLKTFLPTLPDPLMPHLLRGLMDGDGCIALIQGEPRRVIFYGTEQLVGGIADHLTRVLGVTHKSPKPVLSIFGISWQRQRDARAILDYLYADATISLARKHALYTRFLELTARSI